MLQHQMQPTFNTCMATCVAMVASQPVDEVVERWHQKFHDKTDWLDDALDYYKIPYFYGSQRKAAVKPSDIPTLKDYTARLVDQKWLRLAARRRHV
ncbi:hypothetical protein QDY88_001012 [Escherichia coli]|nr:hypothetical protein [Escherichia coli]